MSLVYEALQKAEREKERKTGPAPIATNVTASQPMKTAVAAPPAPKPSSRSYLSFLVVGLSVLGVAALAYVVAITGKRAAELSPSSEGVSRTSATTPETAARPEPRTQTDSAPTENDPRFKLTGIMKMGDNYGAVINGHVVYQDNYVDGAIVKKVERDRVTLNLNGQEIPLRLF